MNKKAQLDFPLITFIILVVSLIIMAPIMLKIFISIKTPWNSAMQNIPGGNLSNENFNKVIDTGINFWDEITIAVFAFAVILMLVSAFLIDAHPFWVILYIIIALFTLLFAPSIIEAANNIYTSSSFATETVYLNFLDTIRVHFGEIIVGLYIITGIIIFGKIALSRSGK